MIIVHENMEMEAESVSEVLKQVFGLESKLINADLSNVFVRHLTLDGYAESKAEIGGYLSDELSEATKNERVMVLTPRDLYIGYGDSKEDDWIFGYNVGKFSVVAAARLRGKEGEPSSEVKIPDLLYLARVNLMAVHEFGHGAVKNPDFKQAVWVNAQTGYRVPLGSHCTDNSCAMYEIVDVKAPKPEEGYMQLGFGAELEKRFDAGLDDVIARLNPDFFCTPCRKSIKIEPLISFFP